MTQRRRRPLSPEAAAVIRAQRSAGRFSRRTLFAGAGTAGLGAALAACGTSAPGTSGGEGDGRPTAAKDLSATEKKVNWANWTLYLDYDDNTKNYPTLQAFEKESGITATYDEAIEDNDSYYGKIQGQLRNGQDIGKDVIVFTDYMAARVIKQGYVQELNQANLPNAANILDNLKTVDFDNGRKYSLTWQSGYAGIAWNKERLPKGLKSVDDLWKPELKGKVEVLSEMRDTLGLIMLNQGVDISGAFTADQFGNALDVLEEQLTNGQIRQVKGNSYKEDLISGDALAVIGWSGDITQLNAENGDKWGFAIPEAGGTLWSDNMLVPIGSPHRTNAEALMNYYYDPEVAAEVAAYVNYICPVKGAQEVMASSKDKELRALAKNPKIFPDQADLAKVKVFRTLEGTEETEFTSEFQRVLGN
ncbi:spermidine/putrescine ABC transporter substrate-binding protein [Kineosporia rhizophila]|uniref:ABC transporter substrate-binding protein n=1 Tax=Kineosporia TaxID=49184 RepID=UPI001E446025|nr:MULTISPECIES: spermidine/putrescine ABC transporter substrate-binding protein [Kineosporia]MCE0538914.1 spermidine/putrescine ABC transporter substrate-binding protein [Kineosporia rhizophila]GLY16225.1 polyamine-binding lipoprotein [Kineosporia sp. NBRC 101677]